VERKGLIQVEMIYMGKIADNVEKIYKSDVPLDQKIIHLVGYGKNVAINNYNFGILLNEIKKYRWENSRQEEDW